MPAASYLLPVEPSASIASAMSVHCKYQSARYHLELNASISSIASGEASSTSASIRVSMTSMLEQWPMSFLQSQNPDDGHFEARNPSYSYIGNRICL